MTVSITDTSVLVLLAQRDSFSVLARLALPAIVPDIIETEEILPAAAKHPEHVQRYQLAKQSGLFRLEPLLGAAYGDYLRLRKRRSSPARNRGEDACVALALLYPGSVIYLDDDRGANRARDELGDPARVKTSADLPWIGLPVLVRRERDGAG